MKLYTISITVMAIGFILILQPQLYAQGVGINAIDPDRILEVRGTGGHYIRVRSDLAGSPGLELIRGVAANSARDWSIVNSARFRIRTSTDDFDTYDNVLVLDEDGNLGIGMTLPAAPLNIVADMVASNEDDGSILLGDKTGFNLVASGTTLLARFNGNAAPLVLQQYGGNTHISTSGNTYFARWAGHLSVGGNYSNGKVNLEGDGHQLSLRNIEGGVNEWFISATSGSWLVGDDQLIFSPSSSSTDAILRLVDVSDNNGTQAPVMIHSTGDDQMMLLDGNEIDTREGPLYINHNSGHNTYINSNGGRVSIGTTDSEGVLHITTTSAALTLEQASDYWQVTPVLNGDIFFVWGNFSVAYVDRSEGGQWVALSDKRMKRNILPLDRVMNRVRKLGIYNYTYRQGSGRRDLGVIAQEVEPLFPEVVYVNEGQYGVAYDQLSVIAIKGIQEQQKELESLQEAADALLAKYE